VHGITGVKLRYFNVAGDVLGYIDSHAENVFPILMETALGKRDSFTIYGTDYDTRDGTCVRDYIHVQDLVDAHIKALDCNENQTLNLGTGTGTSVSELVSMTQKVTGVDFRVVEGKRRAGDPAALVASFEKAKRVLGWEPKRGIKKMLESTYRAYRNDYEQ
jgi:UDP-glucose 4-epimerase